MHACSACEPAWLKLNCRRHNSCAYPESFVRGDPTLKMFVFKVDEGREDLSPTLSGPSSARQRNAIKWPFACMTMNAPHWMLASQLRFFRGSGPVLLESPIFLWFFRGGGVRTWIRTCNFMIFWYLQREAKTQTSMRKCAFSIQHWWLRYVKHHRFYVEWINFASHDWNHHLKKALLYISLYKQTYLANLLCCLTLWFE